MKKKLVTITLYLLFGVSVVTGCGKSDEQKAQDEIMSHMDSDEKSNKTKAASKQQGLQYRHDILTVIL